MNSGTDRGGLTERVSVIVPTLNELTSVGALLMQLAPLRARGDEVIVVDGRSTDDTVAQAVPHCDRVVTTAAGRARQLNAGARAARHEWLWFVHADSMLRAPVDKYCDAIVASNGWGFFRVRLSGAGAMLRIVETAMNLRSRLTGIGTGDQGLFVRRGLFDAVGGFAPIDLMEDVALSKALRRQSRPTVAPVVLGTSSRRWEADGCLRTIALMWELRLRYFLGADPAVLAARYERRRTR